MPDNNRKILSNYNLTMLELNSYFTYDPVRNVIITNFYNLQKTTEHPANKGFIMFSKKLGKKITFGIEAINIWIKFQSDENLSKYSLYTVNNAVNKLRIMYQPINESKVIDMLKSEFNGIQTIKKEN